jgi:hypothetical protein
VTDGERLRLVADVLDVLSEAEAILVALGAEIDQIDAAVRDALA